MANARPNLFAPIALLLLARYSSLVALRRVRHGPVPRPDLAGDVSALIATFNEATSIAGTVAELRRHHPDVEIVVADDGSTDETQVICRRLAETDPAITLTAGLRRGKLPTLADGLSRVTTPYVVTVDADTHVTASTLATLVQSMKDRRLGACAGNMHLPRSSSVLGAMQSLEFALLNGDRRLLDRFGAVSILPGAMTAWRTDLLTSLLRDATNDIDLSLQALCRGERLGFEESAVCFTGVPTTLVGLLRQRRRWARRKVNRAPGIAATILDRSTPGRGRLAQGHILTVHVVVALLGPCVDARGITAMIDVLRTGGRPTSRRTLTAYIAVLFVGAVALSRSDSDVRHPVYLVLFGPWERSIRGIAALSAIIWPRRNTTDWIPART